MREPIPLKVLKAIPPDLVNGEYPESYRVRLVTSRVLDEYEELAMKENRQQKIVRVVSGELVVIATMDYLKLNARDIADEVADAERKGAKLRAAAEAKRAAMQDLADSIDFD